MSLQWYKKIFGYFWRMIGKQLLFLELGIKGKSKAFIPLFLGNIYPSVKKVIEVKY